MTISQKRNIRQFEFSETKYSKKIRTSKVSNLQPGKKVELNFFVPKNFE